MTFCYNCGQQLTMSSEKFCPNCGQNFSKKEIKGDNKRETSSISIHGNQGDVFGVGFTGNENVFGKNIVVGSGTINVSPQELEKIPVPEYAKALKDFSETINQKLNGRQIPEEQIKEINRSLNALAKEVEDVRQGEGEKEQEIDYEKQKNIEAKIGGIIQRVLKVLPQAAETAVTFTPLSPFSKIIGKGVEQLVEEISKRTKL